MRVIVTGAGGFVGRALTTRLRQQGHTVIALDQEPSGSAENALQVIGDLSDRQVRRAALQLGFDAIVHLATLPGGAAEADPVASRRINCDATYDLIVEAAERVPGVRFVFASSIAVFGSLPLDGVDDATPLSPRMIYGGHKAMMEQAVALFSSRGAIDGLSMRLPGIVARPSGSRAMKSAFMSDIFHAVSKGEQFVCPVSAQGTVWMQSAHICVENLMHALEMDTIGLPATRAITLPACRTTLRQLSLEIAGQCGVTPELVEYDSDPTLEAAFASMPPLTTDCALSSGFVGDADLPSLVNEVLRQIAADAAAQSN